MILLAGPKKSFSISCKSTFLRRKNISKDKTEILVAIA